MEELSLFIRSKLLSHGADLVGFGDLRALDPIARHRLPTGIIVAIKIPKNIVKGITDLPTEDYYIQYNTINNELDELVEFGAEMIKKSGWRAIAQTRAFVSDNETDYSTLLPHKTIATRAGIGWIGKCALLVTEPYGSAIRLSSILTDAPLETAKPEDHSRCGSCMICKDCCPAGAVKGNNWFTGLDRDGFFDAYACRETARRRSFKSFGLEVSLCGKCITACPYTQKYINRR